MLGSRSTADDSSQLLQLRSHSHVWLIHFFTEVEQCMMLLLLMLLQILLTFK
jgi:hypothetical protein